jgi:hypothetical protein
MGIDCMSASKRYIVPGFALEEAASMRITVLAASHASIKAAPSSLPAHIYPITGLLGQSFGVHNIYIVRMSSPVIKEDALRLAASPPAVDMDP